MKIHFKGLKYLDSNDYDYVILKEAPKTKDIKIQIKNKNDKERFETISPSIPILFSKRIKELKE